ncbi:MAG: hypothetical protein HY774_02325 [Acidobacteria bacterium]|nr:hypothetical protein [Acidobacteriota bacterium]
MSTKIYRETQEAAQLLETLRGRRTPAIQPATREELELVIEQLRRPSRSPRTTMVVSPVSPGTGETEEPTGPATTTVTLEPQSDCLTESATDASPDTGSVAPPSLTPPTATVIRQIESVADFFRRMVLSSKASG